MTNLLLDVGNEDGLSFYAGPGVGFAWGKFDLDNDEDRRHDDDDVKDGGVAWQRSPACAMRSTRTSIWASSIATSIRAGSRRAVDIDGGC